MTTSVIGREADSLQEKECELFPAAYKEKKPDSVVGREADGGGWKSTATSDSASVRAWFATDGIYNLGVATGRRSGIFVIDVDRKPGGADGFASLAQAEAELGPLPPTVTVESGGGGLHLYFKYPTDGPLPQRNPWRPGIDVKSDGGLIIGPGSVHPNGRLYSSPPGLSAAEIGFANCPQGWVDDIRDKQPERQATRVASGAIAKGTRNVSLHRYASALRGSGAEEAEILEALRVRNSTLCESPLPDAELATIARSVMGYDPNPTMSDLCFARMLIAQHGQDIRFCHEHGKWYVFTGSVWRPDTDGHVIRLMKGILDAELAKAATIQDGDARKEARNAVVRAQSNGRIVSGVGVATTEPEAPITPGAFNHHPMELNVRNGVVDLTTGEFREHQREDFMTRICDASYHPEAECPRLMAFLDQIFAGDRELIAFVQQSFGYAATGKTSEQCLHLFHGEGANGKSVLLNTAREVLGTYAMHSPTETFLAGGRGASNDLARLDGARLVTVIESEHGGKLAESKIKQITGGEPVTARFLFKEFFEFKPSFKLMFATNHRPEISSDAAMWRRMHQVPFNVVIPREQRQREYETVLLEERDGILRWIVEGAVQWHRHGLIVPPSVREATDAYRREMDHVGAFIEDMCERVPGAREAASDCYAAFTSWALDEGRPVMSLHEFGQELSKRGIEGKKLGGKRWRLNVRLRVCKPRLVEAA